MALSEESEPDIYRAIRFGAVVENCVIDGNDRTVDYDDISLTENTRCAYPLEFIPNAKMPALGTHPNHIILLTCDGYGVLPPVSKLSKEQVIYHFISGYTSKMAGTEEGITKPVAAFSACFGEPFLVWHPVKYGTLTVYLPTHPPAHLPTYLTTCLLTYRPQDMPRSSSSYTYLPTYIPTYLHTCIKVRHYVS